MTEINRNEIELEKSLSRFAEYLRNWAITEPEISLILGNVRRMQYEAYTFGKVDGRVELVPQLLNSLPLRTDWDDDVKVTFQMGVNAMREVLESHLPTPITPKETP